MKITSTFRVLLVALSLMMAFSLFACAEEQSTAPTDAPGTDASTEAPTATESQAPEATEGNDTNETTEASETTKETEPKETEPAGCSHELENIPAVPATCTEPGMKSGIKCKLCDEVLVEPKETPATGHKWDNGTTATPTKCGDTADVTYACTNAGCTETRVETGVALEHVWVSTSSTPATCVAAGSESFKCDREGCEETKTENIAIDPNAHAWTIDGEAQEPTCENEGVTNYKCENEGCTQTRQDKVDALGHDWKSVSSTPATCVAAGAESFKCDREGCEETKTENIAIDPNAHVWGEGEVTQAPTCTAEGVMTYKCTLDESHTKTEPIPTKHNIQRQPAKDGFDEYDKCADCGQMWTIEGEAITAPPAMLGNIARPAALAVGETNTVDAFANGYYFNWTATGSGKLKVTMLTESNWQIVVGETAYNADNTEDNIAYIPVKKGEVLLFSVGAADSTSATISFKAEYYWSAEAGTFDIIEARNAIISYDDDGNLVVSNDLEKLANADNDVFVTLLNKTVTSGRYVKIIYKTENADCNGHVQGFDKDGTAISWKNFIFTPKKDGEWQIAIIDTWNYLGLNGTLNTFRIDCCETKTESRSITFKQIEMIDLEVITDNLNYNLNGASLNVATCTQTDSVLNLEENYVTFSRAENSSDRYIRFYPKAKADGRYLVLKYRSNDASFKELVIFTSTVNADQKDGDQFTAKGFVGDGEWHYIIIDLAKSKTVTANENNEYLINYIRFNTPVSALDIAYLGLHDNTDEIYTTLNIPVYGGTGSALNNTTNHHTAISRDAEGNLVVTNNQGGTGTDCQVQFLPADASMSVYGRYIVLTVKASHSTMNISNIYSTDAVNTSWYDLGGAVLTPYNCEWVTVIVDTFNIVDSNGVPKRAENAPMTKLRIDCCDGSKEYSMTFKTVALYNDLDQAIEAAGGTPIIAKGFTLPTE